MQAKDQPSHPSKPGVVEEFHQRTTSHVSNSELFASSSYRLCRNLHFIFKSDLKTGMLYIGQASLASHDAAVVAAKRHVYGM